MFEIHIEGRRPEPFAVVTSVPVIPRVGDVVVTEGMVGFKILLVVIMDNADHVSCVAERIPEVWEYIRDVSDGS